MSERAAARAGPLVLLAVVSSGLGWLAGSGRRAPDPTTDRLEQIEVRLGDQARDRTEQLAVLREQSKALARQSELLAALAEERGPQSAAGGTTEDLTVGSSSPLPRRRAEISVDGAPSLGAAEAPVTIVAFSDFQCPHCATMAPVLDRVLDAYPRKVRLVFKHCPAPSHPLAFDAHRTSAAASLQGRFWQMYEFLFAHQSDLATTDLRKHAGMLGLNLEQYDEDIRGKEVRERIAKDKADAVDLGIERVPTFFVNGLVLEGAQPFEVLRVEVKAELDRLARAE